MANSIYALIIAFSMYSRIPMPKIEWTTERMRYLLCYFPLVGAVIGLAMEVWLHFGMKIVGNESFFTAVWILIPILITGGIHMDGFLDTSDALNSYKPMEEKLEILKDSHAGAFAILMGICYFVLSYGVYSAVTKRGMAVLAVGFVLSRSLSGLSIVCFKKAKKSGLVAAFSDAAQRKQVGIVMTLYILSCLALLLWLDRFLGSVCFASSLLVFGYYRLMSYKKFGGTTGDLAGFFLQVCELAQAAAVVIAENLR